MSSDTSPKDGVPSRELAHVGPLGDVNTLTGFVSLPRTLSPPTASSTSSSSRRSHNLTRQEAESRGRGIESFRHLGTDCKRAWVRLSLRFQGPFRRPAEATRIPAAAVGTKLKNQKAGPQASHRKNRKKGEKDEKAFVGLEGSREPEKARERERGGYENRLEETKEKGTDHPDHIPLERSDLERLCSGEVSVSLSPQTASKPPTIPRALLENVFQFQSDPALGQTPQTNTHSPGETHSGVWHEREMQRKILEGQETAGRSASRREGKEKSSPRQTITVRPFSPKSRRPSLLGMSEEAIRQAGERLSPGGERLSPPTSKRPGKERRKGMKRNSSVTFGKEVIDAVSACEGMFHAAQGMVRTARMTREFSDEDLPS
uniref:Uncharacterized protein n=1 Tax=Chromera velia CCMP2878 TaxID=1169474 RepID=A0A0G4H8G5_9ALVE|eukprot:Cvel_877.t1-p1 / transcript=Cvel_877.t1 / gene=Cvel_877 / organism=Chromera_velia_CCMP2878 / gene_product=hypothetical protein / transcript_product=hypothetical protein / location=Cvel_scaffold27:137494-140842(+) / protein_length=373 / sequence_SO=supercontig / SO=protein_coding / is_pseudo=false